MRAPGGTAPVKALGAAALGAAAAGFAYYHAQAPTSQLYGATICREPAAGPLIALTYDDGPNPAHTPALLEVLERHGARATFFSIGKWAQREPGLLREVHAAGHAIGNHTQTHPTLALESGAGVADELSRCREAVEGAGVEFSQVDGAALMRPPWGRRRPGTLRAIRAAGYVPVLWSDHVLGLARARDRGRLRRAREEGTGRRRDPPPRRLAPARPRATAATRCGPPTRSSSRWWPTATGS